MNLVTVAANPASLQDKLQDVQKFCSPQLVSFWECMNETVQDVIRGGNWSGRGCCHLPQSGKCKLACVKAESRTELTLNCRQSDEIDFFECLVRQETGDECCGNAHNVECRAACSAIFRTERTPSRAAREAVLESCAEHSPRVLQVKTTTQEIVDTMQEGGCGPPLPQEKVWQCFLQGLSTGSGSASAPGGVGGASEVSRIDRLGIDSAKLHCCHKASTTACRKLCLKTFSNEWTRQHELFDRDCVSQMSEQKLAHCLEEVEEPCELGCDGLNFCTNFNNRPTELFRSCSAQADEAARYDLALWQQHNHLQLPGLVVPILNISSCSPQAWKTVACALQTRPCHSATHASHICREDCFELLSECIDRDRLPPGITAASLCARLAPEAPPDAPCISLKPFLEPSKWRVDRESLRPGEQVTAPCRGDPCNTSEVCAVNRNCAPGRPCSPYTCSTGCKLGEVSHYVVPQGSYVRIPLSSGGKSCLKVCRCSGQGIIEAEHGAWFYMDCNLCSCYAGEITCSKRQCQVTSRSSLVQSKPQDFSSLPCNCPPHHVPVCGRNGNTYPSSCLAKCAGLKDADFEFGPCSSKDPCEPNPCSDGHRCVAARQVCLTLVHKPCLQFQCVDVMTPCTSFAHEPMCDTDNQEHPNLCYLVRYGKRLAYKGHCLNNCRSQGLVCGIDGQTHLSECAALAARVAVDYSGPCVAVGLAGDLPVPRCGESVQCPPLSSPGCQASTPPGACCPVCGGALRLLYSQKQVDRALYAVRDVSAMSLSAILTALNRHVQVAECQLYGFLTVELDIYVLLKSSVASPSELQLAACVGEAEKLANLVQHSSPRLLSELSLSALTAAAVAHSTSVATSTVTPAVLGLVLIASLLHWSH
ncbi:hypothetical protein B566_EDAN002137 [Ephemera danica]|nr:hypothetical protein B566_EDAN002137 [Ephemera danica]